VLCPVVGLGEPLQEIILIDFQRGRPRPLRRRRPVRAPGHPCTRAGQDTLAGWLLAPAGAAEVRDRQAAIAELRGRLDLRATYPS
jgi:hypothetical protein